MDCLQLRRRRKERHQEKLSQHYAQNSPTHSQPSSFGPAGSRVGVPVHPHQDLDPRLPKVGSSGLWMGTPSMYVSTPSQAYGRPTSLMYYANQYPHQLMQPPIMQRASSETGLPQRSNQVPMGPYVAGGSHQRIYHSQQLAGLVPVYEVVDPRNGSISDVYHTGGGTRTKLLDNGASSGKGSHHDHNHHHHNHHHHHTRHSSKNNKKVERSQSDVHSHHGSRHHKANERPVSETRPSKTDILKAGKSGEVKAHGGGQENGAFSQSTEKLTEVDKVHAVVTSATDSMKLLAKNKTDDQKTTVGTDLDLPADLDNKASDVYKPVIATASVHNHQLATNPARKKTPPPVPEKLSSLHYTHAGDIYAIPEKEHARRRGSDNPILARMQDMLLEREEGTERVVDPVTDITETAEPLLVMPVGQPPIRNPLYQEEEDGGEEGGDESSRTKHIDGGAFRSVADAAKSAAVSPETGRDTSDGASALGDAAAASAVTSLKEAGASGDDDRSSGNWMEPRLSIDTDAATGKHISETTRAFDFLDSYLSDDDATDIQSPPKSPVMSERGGLMC